MFASAFNDCAKTLWILACLTVWCTKTSHKAVFSTFLPGEWIGYIEQTGTFGVVDFEFSRCSHKYKPSLTAGFRENNHIWVYCWVVPGVLMAVRSNLQKAAKTSKTNMFWKKSRKNQRIITIRLRRKQFKETQFTKKHDIYWVYCWRLSWIWNCFCFAFSIWFVLLLESRFVLLILHFWKAFPIVCNSGPEISEKKAKEEKFMKEMKIPIELHLNLHSIWRLKASETSETKALVGLDNGRTSNWTFKNADCNGKVCLMHRLQVPVFHW